MSLFKTMIAAGLSIAIVAAPAQAQNRRARSRAAAGPAHAPPTPLEVLRLSDRLNAQYYGYRLNGEPGVLIEVTPLGEIARSYRSISDVSCARLAPARFRCGYTLTTRVVVGQDNSLASLAGSFQAALNPNPVMTRRWTYTFAYRNGWSSADLEANVRAYALQARQRTANERPTYTTHCERRLDPMSTPWNGVPRYQTVCGIPDR
jgi:hypothetical protein